MKLTKYKRYEIWLVFSNYYIKNKKLYQNEIKCILKLKVDTLLRGKIKKKLLRHKIVFSKLFSYLFNAIFLIKFE